jgi:hypothetical protein
MTVEVKGFGKITADERVLNLLSMFADEAAGKYKKDDIDLLAEGAKEFSDSIYGALREIGYYNS